MNKSDYPLILQIKDVKEILGVSRSTAYEIAREPDFPLLVVNCRKIVYRDDFCWTPSVPIPMRYQHNAIFDVEMAKAISTIFRKDDHL
ncbi:AlpA family phage regulatory protein [Paenibacillus glucanolyticus]|uniref:helix-turn-helix transcriptional regulator n=1 Tax=Paenibacillus glucanolyticus TaxID=59843 RepID=UPI0030C92752